MNIGISGTDTGSSVWAKPRISASRSRPGSVASRALPRRKGGMPEKPGTLATKRRGSFSWSPSSRSMSSGRRGS